MKEQLPKVGNIVIFHHPKAKETNSPLFHSPAIVTKINDDATLNLFLMAVNEFTTFKKNIAFGDKEYQWSWID